MTVDEFTWGKPLKMGTKVNGEIRQNSDTSDLYFGIEALVAYASRSMTLFPGDIICDRVPGRRCLLHESAAISAAGRFRVLRNRERRGHRKPRPT